MYDILVFGKTQDEHDNHLKAVFKQIEEANVTLSPQKCEFSKTKLTFLVHVIDADGIRADPEKTKAIVSRAKQKALLSNYAHARLIVADS